MTKQEFIKLFDLEKIYEEYKSNIPFVFGLHDRQTGTKNAIFYVFEENKLKIVIECNEFNQEQKIQTLEIHLIFEETDIKLNKDEVFINEIFPFLTFETNFDASLKFIADFNNKILKTKYRLMGSVTMY